jgi:flagellar biosynthesis anti-sigma factor FlgM
MNRIDRSNIESPRPDPAQRTPASGHKANRTEEKGNWASPNDQVDISERARLLSRLRQAVYEAPDVREERVRQLQRAIDEGSYTPDSRDIAEHLLRHQGE